MCPINHFRHELAQTIAWNLIYAITSNNSNNPGKRQDVLLNLSLVFETETENIFFSLIAHLGYKNLQKYSQESKIVKLENQTPKKDIMCENPLSYLDRNDSM